jgi:HMG (high mobility group) box
VTPRASHEVPCPIFRSHKRKDTSLTVRTFLVIFPFIFSPHLRKMDSLGAPHFGCSSLPPAPSSASSTGTRSQFPFIASTQVPESISASRDAPWLDAGSPSLQSSPGPTDTFPGFMTQRETRENVSFQMPQQYDFSALPGSPAVNSQPQEFVLPYSQYPASICIDSWPAFKEKRPQRPRNAFMLFRSDLLRRGLIPKDQETRQHRLSIIAGKCWHRLSKEEKEKWFLQGEHEKKVYAVKYGGNRLRARTKAKREPKPTLRTEELEQLDRLADVAYQEISNGVLSQPAPGSTTSPPATPASPFQLNTDELPLLISGSQEPAENFTSPFSSPAGDAGFAVQSFQFPQMTTTTNDTFQNAGMFRGVGHLYLAFIGTR